jgi:hypothetical protein
MVWLAYGGFSGSIVVSFATLALLLGLPVDGIARLTLTTMIGLLTFGLVVQLCAGAVAGKLKLPTRGRISAGPVLPPLTHAAAAPKALQVQQPPAKRSRVAGLKPPLPEHT